MKVLMTTDAVGGVWTHALELSRGLRERGHDVALACMGPEPSQAQRHEAASAGVTLHVGAYRLEWMQDPWRDVERAGDWLLDLERDEAPDVVHLNGYTHADLPWGAPRLVVGHSCVLGWWDAVRGTVAPPEWDEYRSRVAAGIRAADALAAPTHAMVDVLARHYGPLPRGAHVIPNGRDPHAFMARRKEPFALAVGRLWDEAKDAAALDAAAESAPWPVLAAGDAQDPDTGQVRPLRHARALGRVPDDALRDLYARAAVYVLPARYEPFGLGALEAALSGCALVVSDIPTLREVWGDAALYAAPGDATALRAAIRRYAESPPLRARMARKASRRASRYTRERMTLDYLAVYDELMEARTAGAADGAEEASTCAS